jgi:hypothetical protein
MKRNWDPSSSSYSAAASQNPDDAVWNHPYASAYSSIAIPFNPSPLQNSINVQNFDSVHTYGINGPAEKKAKVSGGEAMAREGSSQGKDESEGDDDEDDDDDDDDEEQQAGGKGAPARKGGKAGKGVDGKPKVKLTRGSR